MAIKLAAMTVLLSTAILGCTGVPRGLEAVSGFDGQRYMGKWYEIARLDHSFERNLSNVSATYARNDDGTMSVVNRGFNEKSGEWKQITGESRFIGEESIGSLKVSFFGPFYGGYHVIDLDRTDYAYAMVAGPNRSYLWILSRSKTLDESILSDLKTKASQWGFKTSDLIVVKHDRPDE